MPDITIKPKGGHLIEVVGEKIFLTDDSGERGSVDVEGNICVNGRSFDIPLMDGNWTPAGAEEAFLVASYMQRPIKAGARRFEIKQVSATVTCKLCQKAVAAATAHRHQGRYVGDECCWDERMKATE